MKRIVIGLTVTLALIGCDKIVAEKQLSVNVVEKIVRCEKFSYCHTCGMDFGGKYTCGWRLSGDCPGERLAIVRETTTERTHESGKISHWTSNTTLGYKTSCQ